MRGNSNPTELRNEVMDYSYHIPGNVHPYKLELCVVSTEGISSVQPYSAWVVRTMVGKMLVRLHAMW